MRFKVRDGFAIHLSRLVEISGLNGESVTEIQNNSYYAGQVVDFSPADALDHAHKLEPFDKEAKAWLEARAVNVADSVPAAALDANALAAVVAAAVAQAMAAQAAQSNAAGTSAAT